MKTKPTHYIRLMNDNIRKELESIRTDKIKLKRVMGWLFVSLALCFIMSYFAASKKGGGDLYLSTMLYYVAITFVLFLFTELTDSNRAFAMLVAFLMLIGVVIQLMLLLPGENVSGIPLVVHAALGTLAGLIAVPVIDFLLRMRNSTAKLSILATAICIVFYGFLLVFTQEVNGTHNWINIGGQSFQLTEITKLFAIIAIAVIFAEQKWTPEKRLVLAGIVLGINAVGLVLVNELGTLLVLSGIYFILALIFNVKAKHLLVLLLGAAVVCSFAFLFFKLASDSLNAELAELSDEDVITLVQEMQKKAEAGDERYSSIDFDFMEQLLKDYASMEDGTLDTEEYSEACSLVKDQLAASHSSLFNLRIKLFEKIKLRFDVMLGKGSYDAAYQITAARDAVIISKWLGSNNDARNVPIISSDFIAVYLLTRLGVIVTGLVVFAFGALGVTGIPAAISSPFTKEASLAVSFIACIILSAAIEMSSSFGILPTVGICLPFISKGGTNLLTNLLMVYYIIFACRKHRCYAAFVEV